MDVGSAIVALSGTVIGAGLTLAMELVRARIGDRASRRNALLASCSSFTAAVARMRSLCAELDVDPANRERARLQLEEIRVECERLRLLLDDRTTQRAARLALRHVYAVWQLAAEGVDLRAEQYPGQAPNERLRAALTDLYVGVRRETGSRAPEAVFAELED
ncbi:hypothetical protein ACPPVO_40445 [Dactylosporangium sp. McL0621]|uniref:hypothetical protein n=1 Tax=Dactylosporangium sp. McL0621 TaxID=3415678 RepID=UPI003CFA9696